MKLDRGLIAGLFCIGAVFVVDVTCPFGAVIGVAYVIVAIGGFFMTARDAIILAIAATAANALGFLFTPPAEAPAWIVATIRGSTVFTTWLLIVTGIHFHKQSQAVIAAIRQSNERRRLALEEAERAQRDRVTELQLLTNAIPMLIAYVDAAETVQFANSAHEAVFAAAVIDTQGNTFQSLVGDDLYRRLKPQVILVLKGQRVQFEEQIVRDDGVYFYLFQFLPRIDESQNVVGFYALVTDISGLKRSQEEVDLQREALALYNRRGAATEMAAALAHEMNQPLGSIAIYAGRLVELHNEGRLSPDDVVPAMQFMREEALRAGEVVKKARQMVEDKPLLPTTIDSADLLDSVKKICGAKAATEGVAIELDLPPIAPAMYADRVQLQQVLVNLITNAVDASADLPPNRRHVTVRVDEENGGIHFTVSDLGTGFGSSDGERVFKPHYTTKSDGLGIGLTIARSIVSMHQGRLWAEPNPDYGVSFHVTLPPPPSDGLVERISTSWPPPKENR